VPIRFSAIIFPKFVPAAILCLPSQIFLYFWVFPNEEKKKRGEFSSTYLPSLFDFSTLVNDMLIERRESTAAAKSAIFYTLLSIILQIYIMEVNIKEEKM
jgi:hypothetical protein